MLWVLIRIPSLFVMLLQTTKITTINAENIANAAMENRICSLVMLVCFEL